MLSCLQLGQCGWTVDPTRVPRGWQVTKRARKQTETQEKRWQRWLDSGCSASGAGTGAARVGDETAVKLVRQGGVPAALRGAVWGRLARIDELRCSAEAAGHSYADWSREPERAVSSFGGVPGGQQQELTAEEEYLYQIEKDLGRTFPSHRLFDQSSAGMGGIGVGVLRRMLRAFVRRNLEKIGYVQSMNYIAATIIIALIPCDSRSVIRVGMLGLARRNDMFGRIWPYSLYSRAVFATPALSCVRTQILSSM